MFTLSWNRNVIITSYYNNLSWLLSIIIINNERPFVNIIKILKGQKCQKNKN